MAKRDRRHDRVPKNAAKMTHNQYNAARETLAWTHERLAQVIGVGERTPYRYASGDVAIPEPAARLLRLLVLLRLTLSERKFEEIIKQLH